MKKRNINIDAIEDIFVLEKMDEITELMIDLYDPDSKNYRGKDKTIEQQKEVLRKNKKIDDLFKELDLIIKKSE